MLKYIKHHMEGIDNVEIYPMISLIIFFTVFVAMIIFVMKMPRHKIEKVSQIPFEDDSNSKEMNNE